MCSISFIRSMQTFNGTHGTSLQRAVSIQANGFRASEVGRAGRGVYFWDYRKDSVFAVKLAEGWFDFMKRTNCFKDEKNPQGAVIFGVVEADSEDVLDCADQDVLEEIALSLQHLKQVTDADIHAAYEMVVANVEKILGRPMMVVKAAVAPPAKIDFPLKNVLGNPAIFVVREHLEKIKVRIEQFNKGSE